jgi:DNA-binding CsgD family transcriptional regulator
MNIFSRIESSRNLSLTLILSFGIWAIADVVREYHNGEMLSHLSFELVVGVLAVLWSFHHLMQGKIDSLTQEAEEWRMQNAKLIHGLSQSIQDQMIQWGLTPAEQEVTLLVLKGLTFKEIADIRATSEKTTRQQAMTIYQKSKLPGRAELSAFFLEDLLKLPPA